MKHIIWSTEIDFDKDWKDWMEVDYPDLTEEEKVQLAYELNNEYFEDEKLNLNKELCRPVVMYGTLGLWNGTRSGYKFLKGTNLNEILSGSCGDYVTWYVENGEVKCDDIHHDGTNHYTYRVLKHNADQYDFEEEAYENLNVAVEKYTEPLGSYVSEIYGW